MTLTVPPVAETATASPPRDAPNAFVTAIATAGAFGASKTETVAATPLGIVFELTPVARQVYALALPAQVTDLFAETNAAPAATVKPVTLADGWLKVHCKAAGSFPAGEDKERLSDTALPATAVPDESTKDDCASRALEQLQKRTALSREPPNPRLVISDTFQIVSIAILELFLRV